MNNSEIKTATQGCFIPMVIGSILAIALLDSVVIGVIIFVVGLILFFAILFTPKATRSSFTIDDIELRKAGEGARTLIDTEFFCRIAGVEHHKNECGAFIGFVCAEPDNKYDKNAIAVYDEDSKLVGYIPRSEHLRFREWRSEVRVLPCIGFIEDQFNNGALRGKVKVIDSDRITTEVHIIKFVIWLINNYDTSYIPKLYRTYSSCTARSADKWLNHLSDVLATKDAERKELNRKIKKEQALRDKDSACAHEN